MKNNNNWKLKSQFVFLDEDKRKKKQFIIWSLTTFAMQIRQSKSLIQTNINNFIEYFMYEAKH